MSFFNKIKVNYNLKLMDDYVLNKKQPELFALLKKLKIKDKEIFFTYSTILSINIKKMKYKKIL